MSSSFTDISDKLRTPKGTQLASRYRVGQFLGEGGFVMSQVMECVDTTTNGNVAKMTTDYFQEVARKEKLETLDADQSHITQWNRSFVHNDHTCLSFEVLDVTLDEYLKAVQFMTISEIRPVLQQLATALLHLEALDIVHSDIKPESIMVLKWQKPLQVKLIDFGLACQGPDIQPGSGGQSLLYRAPELMLGLSYRQPIDMWSVGLIVAEMALGRPLLPGKHEYDIMKNIVNTLGEPPTYQLDAGLRSMQYFTMCGTWRLKTSEELHAQTGLHYSDRKCFNSSCALEEIMYQGLRGEEEEVEHFIDLLKKMLNVNKNERITPAQVLKHPFLAVEHHGDGPRMTVTKEEQPDPLTSEEVHPSPPGINVSCNLEDEEETTASVQPEVVAESRTK